MLENPPSADSPRPTPREYVGADGPLTDRPTGLSLPPDACRAILLDALAGVDLGPWDERMIDWFVSRDHDVLRTLVSFLVRVREAGTSGRTVRPAEVGPGPSWITIPEICSLLQISPGEWREWQEEGPAPFHLVRDGVVLVRRADFERWLDGLPTGDLADGALAESGQRLADVHLIDEYVLFDVDPQGCDLGRQGATEVCTGLTDSGEGLADPRDGFAGAPNPLAESSSKGGEDD